MASTAQRAAEASTLRPRRVRFQHAVPRRSHDPRNEHRATLHEGAQQPDAWTSGEQQLLLHQRQHRAGRLRVVRDARRVLGRHPNALREEQHQLPARKLVAGTRRPLRGQHSRLPLHATTGRPRVGQRRVSFKLFLLICDAPHDAKDSTFVLLIKSLKENFLKSLTTFRSLASCESPSRVVTNIKFLFI